ncbi:MAG: hydroxymethylglutaryl-CoA lyase, partial [Chloroflexota bacterium]
SAGAHGVRWRPNRRQRRPSGERPAAKVAFIDALSGAGFQIIEATSFVNPRAVPRMADAADVLAAIRRRPGTRYLALVPNERGLDRAIDAGVDAIALFSAATDQFAQANVGASIDETFDRFAPVVARAKAAGCWIRGYVSVAFGCPYSGPVNPADAVEFAERLADLGCDELSLADTIGSATPAMVQDVLHVARGRIPLERTGLHLHDTGGRAIENVEAALAAGIRIFDGSAGGLGGCPFAPGAPGNLATETLLDFLHARGYRTGVDAAEVRRASASLRQAIAAAAEA